MSILSLIQVSSKLAPCPVCDRIKDGDCRILHGGDVVWCHTERADNPAIVEHREYKFSRNSDNAQGFGIWYKPNPQKFGRETVEPQVLYEYPARDGSQLIRVVRQKGGKVEFYQQYFIDGQWIGPRKAEEKGWKGHLETMKKAVPIYRYADVRQAIANGQPVIFAEGESVVDALWELGQPATTSIGGSKALTKWGDYSKDLEGLGHLLIAPDMDKPGYEYGKKVRTFFQGKGVNVIKWLHAYPEFPQWKDLPETGGLDLKDEIQEGLQLEDLLKRVGAAISNGIGYPMDEPPVDRSAYKKKEEQTYEDFLAKVNEIAAIKEYGRRTHALVSFQEKSRYPMQDLRKELRQCISRKRGLLKSEEFDFFSDTSNEKISAIIPNFLYRDNVSMLVGKPGSGKSLLAYDLIFHLVTGGEFMNFPLTPKKVLLIQMDEAEEDCKKRVLERMEEIYELPIPPEEKEFFKRKSLKNLKAIRGLNFSGMDEFGDRLESWKPDVVVIDNFREACARAGVKENEQEAGELMGDLKETCREHGCALLVIHHEVKSTFAEGQNRSSGHGSIIGQCATAFTFDRTTKGNPDEKAIRTLNCIKNRLGDDSRSHQFKFRKQECSWRMEYKGEVDQGGVTRDRAVSDDLAAKILRMTLELRENNPQATECYFSVLDIKRYCGIPDASHYAYGQLEFAQQRGLLKVRHERSEMGGKLRKYYAIDLSNVWRMRESLRIDELIDYQGFQGILDEIASDELNRYVEIKKEKGSRSLDGGISNFKRLEIQREQIDSGDSFNEESLEPLVNNQFINSSTFSQAPQKEAKPKISTDLSKVDPTLDFIKEDERIYAKGGFVKLVGRTGSDQILGLGYTKEGQPFASLALEQRKILLSDLDVVSVPFEIHEWING
jgi:RecA-family ATPase